MIGNLISTKFESPTPERLIRRKTPNDSSTAPYYEFSGKWWTYFRFTSVARYTFCVKNKPARSSFIVGDFDLVDADLVPLVCNDGILAIV